MKKIYFDMASTTPINKYVLWHLWTDMFKYYGNPSSLHYEGRKAFNELEKARVKIANKLGCKPTEIFFTSGASESNSWVAKCSRYRLVATNDSHSSLDDFKFNKQEDVKEKRTQYGEMIAKNILVSYPMINNETGNLHLFYKNYPYCHVDLTQALGKINIDLSENKYIRFASASGHKIGALKGCGILYIREDEQPYMSALICGHQENNLRGGTENTLGIVSFGYAIENAYKNIEKNNNKIAELKSEIIYELSHIKTIKWESHPISNIINITFNKIDSQTAVQLFDQYGICISAGSACNSGLDKPSEVLLAEGYSEEEALRTIRVSLNHKNTVWQTHKFIKILKLIIDKYDF
nr:MAG TPA: cysteine sulfinate desulfinase/cysteine desulfurase [Caudoviricetes sp.]